MGKISSNEVFDSIASGTHEILLTFLDSGGAINVKNDAGWTLVMAAVIAHNIEALDILLGRNASVQMRDNIGFSALDHAIDSRNFVIQGRLRRGASAAVRFG